MFLEKMRLYAMGDEPHGARERKDEGVHSAGARGRYEGLLALLPGTRTLLVTSALLVVTRTLLGAPGLTTRSKDATRSKGHRY